MKKIRVLNLYAGIGGNRKLWSSDEVEVVAVENVPQIANIYHDFFPMDKVIVCDAHEYLLKHFAEFDFIWSSPPCLSHSRARFWGWGSKRPVYPDMKLYEEILFLKHYFKGKWVVENVISYYKPLIEPQIVGRHCFWANFDIFTKRFDYKDIRGLSGTSKKDKLIRNMVEPEIGLHVFNCAFKTRQEVLNNLTYLTSD